MSTATIAANVAFATTAPARRTADERKPRVGVMDVIAAFGEALAATREYETLVEKGAAPADAARKALLGG